MIENAMYCHINGFMKWNISKKTSYIVRKLIGNYKKFIRNYKKLIRNLLERFAFLIWETKETVSLQE